MFRISRREFIYLSAALSLLWRVPAQAAEGIAGDKSALLPITLKILQQAHRVEMIAYNHYLGYSSRALQEGFPNIAYLFRAFSVSEKIHADNYARILENLNKKTHNIPNATEVNSTQANLKRAAQKELEKIEKTYPEYLQNLDAEGFDEAIINCMYAWKSHRQHDKKVRKILRFSGMFFEMMANKIEGKQLDFHICEICGSTIDLPPTAPCEICNMSRSHYSRVARPTAPA